MINLAILTSNPKNSENIIQHFLNNDTINVNCIISNTDNKEYFSRLRRYKIESYTTSKYIEIDKILTNNNIDYLILDCWNEQIPINFCTKYTNKIINIRTHPFDILKNKTEKFGIVIYFIDPEMFKGKIIFYKLEKFKEEYDQGDVDVIISKLEQKYYPNIIEKIINSYDKEN
jgi:phosphoribosylglycinamide formyltransferase 1